MSEGVEMVVMMRDDRNGKPGVEVGSVGIGLLGGKDEWVVIVVKGLYLNFKVKLVDVAWVLKSAGRVWCLN